jgi:SpoVK/Ycf46/Vps4 family AAA+-type ATPase
MESFGPNALRVQSVFPALLDLLDDRLVAALDSAEDLDDHEASQYWDKVHLMFILRILVARTSSEIAGAVFRKHKRDERDDLPYSEVTPSQLSERLTLFRELLNSISFGSQHLLDRVSNAYDLSTLETRVLQFLVTCKIQSDSTIQSLLQSGKERGIASDPDIFFSPEIFRYVCGASPLEMKEILDEDHVLVKDRLLVLTLDEFGGSPTLEASDEACRAFLGQDLSTEDKLKLAGTKLLDIIDGPDNGMAADGSKANSHAKNSASRATIQDMLQSIDLEGSMTPKSADTGDDLEGSSNTSGELVTEADLEGLLDKKLEAPTVKSALDTEQVISDSKEPRRYTCELDYLKDQFDLVLQKVIHSRHRIAQDLRNASVPDSRPSWMRTENTPKVSSGETTAKIRLAQRKIDHSLDLTRKEGTFYPRLELLVDQLGLDAFEKSVLVYLAGSMISPIFKSCLQNEGSIRSEPPVTVGNLLSVFCNSFSEQVACRTYFYRSSKLIRKGLVKPLVNYNGTDLTDQELILDRRVLDCIVGLDKESTEVSQGSNLYEPKVSLDSVVLPHALKSGIVDAVSHFDQFRRYRKHHPSFDEAIAYGTGLTLMFSGQSGTGKTLTANAIAAKLGKKLLLVNYKALDAGERNNRTETSRYQSIFREAELSNAIIFFDECESLFAQRGYGGSSDTTELLTELERFDGIVFLATNRPFDLDEAMYRRISEVFEFQRPNYLERLDIWRIVTSHESIPCEEDIDWESIALQYELTGGFIKNAVIAALLDAVGRDPSSPMITQSDIVDGCKKQVRGALQMMEFDERVVPKAGLDDLIASDSVKKNLEEMVSLEKARGILFSSWGFSDDMRDRQGTTALFWGPSGTGRSRAAEALGFELGKPLKVVDMPRLLVEKKGRRHSDVSSAIREVFQ